MPYVRYQKIIENEVGKENAQLLNIARRTIQRSPSPPYSIKKFDETRATAEKEFVGLIFNRQVTQHLKSKWDVVDGYQAKFREDVTRINDHVNQQHQRYEMAVHQGVKDRISNFEITAKIERLGVVAIYYDNYKHELEEVIEFLKPCDNFLEDCCRLMNMTKTMDIINRHRTLTLFKESLVKDFSIKHLELEDERLRLRNLKEKFEHKYVQSNTLLGGLRNTYDKLDKDNTRIEKGIECILSTASAQFLQHYRKFNSINAIYEKIQQQRMMPKETTEPIEMLCEIECRMVNMTEVVKELNSFNVRKAASAYTSKSTKRSLTKGDFSSKIEVTENVNKGMLQNIKEGKHRIVGAKKQVEQLKGSARSDSLNSLYKEKKGAFKRKMTFTKKGTQKAWSKLNIKHSIGGGTQFDASTDTDAKSTGTTDTKKTDGSKSNKDKRLLKDKNVNRSRDVKKASILSNILGDEGEEEPNSCSSSMTYSRGRVNKKNDLMTVRDVAYILNQDRNHSNKDPCTLSDGFGGSIGQVDIEESISGDVDDAWATYRRARKPGPQNTDHDPTDGGPDSHKLYPDNGYFNQNDNDSNPDSELSDRNAERKDDISSDVNDIKHSYPEKRCSYPNNSNSDSDTEVRNVNANMHDSNPSLNDESGGDDTSRSLSLGSSAASDDEGESQSDTESQTLRTKKDAKKDLANVTNSKKKCADSLFKLDALTFDDDTHPAGCDVSKTTREHVVNDYEVLEDPEADYSRCAVNADDADDADTQDLVDLTNNKDETDDICHPGHLNPRTDGESDITTNSETIKKPFKVWKDKPTMTPRVRTGFLPTTTNKIKASPKQDQTAKNKTTETRKHTTFPPVKNNGIQNTKDSKLVRRAGVQNKDTKNYNNSKFGPKENDRIKREKTENKMLAIKVRTDKPPTSKDRGVIQTNEGKETRTKCRTEKIGEKFKSSIASQNDNPQKTSKTSTISNKSLLPARKQNSVLTEKSSSKTTNRGLQNSTSTHSTKGGHTTRQGRDPTSRGSTSRDLTSRELTSRDPTTRDPTSREPTTRDSTLEKRPIAARARGVSLPAIPTSRHPIRQGQGHNLNSNMTFGAKSQADRASDKLVYDTNRKMGVKGPKEGSKTRKIQIEQTKTDRNGSDTFPKLFNKYSGTQPKIERMMSGRMASLVIHRRTVKHDSSQKALWKN